MSGSAGSELGRVLLVGGGNMGGAMLRGWLADGVPPADLAVLDPSPPEAMRALFDGGVRHVTRPDDVETPDIVVLAVKPQMMNTALPPLRERLGAETLAISVAVGRTVASVEELLGQRPVVRAMPNTPALVRRGITGAYANAMVDERAHARATRLLESCGPVEWVSSENEIDLVAAVSGSGPAYAFLLAEAMAEAGAAAGLDPALAMRLARHTVAGAGELMIRSDDEPAQLRRNVTSPGGTTQAALGVLMDEGRGLPALMREAVQAAKRRAEELSEA